METNMALLDSMIENQLEEIYVIGYLEKNRKRPSFFSAHQIEPYQFHPIWDSLYFQVNQRLICISSIGVSHLFIRETSSVVPTFKKEPEDRYAMYGCLRSSLETGRDAALIQQIKVYTFEDASIGNQTKIAALEVTLDEEDFLFMSIDWNGIHIGNEKSKELWMVGRHEYIYSFLIRKQKKLI